MSKEKCNTIEEAVLLLTNEKDFYVWVCDVWAPAIARCDGNYTHILEWLKGKCNDYFSFPITSNINERYRALGAALIEHYTEEFNLPPVILGWKTALRREQEMEQQTNTWPVNPCQEVMLNTYKQREELTMEKLYEERQYLKGKDIAAMSENDILTEVANIEAEIAQLNKIKAASTKRDKMVKELESGIKKVLAILDKRK